MTDTLVSSCSFSGHTYDVEIFKDDIVSNKIRKKNEPFEKRELTIIESLNLKGTYLDLGANIGNHSLVFSRIGASKVIAIEMADETFEVLHRNMNRSCKCPHLTIQAALGVGLPKTMIEYPGNTGMTRIASHDEALKKIAISKQDGTKVIKEKVVTKRLDDLLPDEQNIVFVKIDVEGQELNVVNSGKKLLNDNQPVIVVESWSENTVKKMCQVLKGYKYRYITKTDLNYFMYPENYATLIEGLSFE